jgi:hypothetical protein
MCHHSTGDLSSTRITIRMPSHPSRRFPSRSIENSSLSLALERVCTLAVQHSANFSHPGLRQPARIGHSRRQMY